MSGLRHDQFRFSEHLSPTQCGLAGFSSALLRHLTGQGSGARAGVVRVVDTVQPAVYPDVVAQLVNGSPTGPATAAAVLNGFDVAVVQHEYVSTADETARMCSLVLAEITVPVIVVLHTVLAAPSTRQRQVLERIADAAAAVVVMSRTAAERLSEGYLVDAAKVSVIPMVRSAAAHVPAGVLQSVRPAGAGGGSAAPHSSHLGPARAGQGHRAGDRGVRRVARHEPGTAVCNRGQTHPKVLEREGEAIATLCGPGRRTWASWPMWNSSPDIGNPDALMELVSSADVVLLPYDSTEQVTSGVLIEAVAAGRPIVATRFPHAVEVLADGAGLLVPHGDVPAMTEALRAVLTGREQAASMRRACGRIAPDVAWSSVADSYRALADSLLAARITAAA